MAVRYRHLDANGVDSWVRGLLAKKGSDTQIDFLRQVTDSTATDFVKHVERAIAGQRATAYDSEGDVPSLLDDAGVPVVVMTAGHMYLMPSKDILNLYKHWKDIPYGEAVCPTLWGSITLAEIKEGRIKPAWLAVSASCSEERAREEIDLAIKNSDMIKIDTLVRRCLRWMMAPGHMRGIAELYSNCSLAKAWWCGRIAYECTQEAQLDTSVEEITESLKTIWLGLADYLAGKLRVISEPNVVAGIACWSGEQIRQQSPPKRKVAEQACRHLGELSSWCVLGMKEPSAIERALVDMQRTMKDDMES